MARPSSRTGLVIALWLVAAAGALLLGLTAVGSIGAGLSGGASATPLSEQDIQDRLAASGPSTPVTSAPVPTAVPGRPAPVSSVVSAGPGGTIVARCTGGTPMVVSVNPAQGFDVDDDGGPSTVVLEGDDVTVRVTLGCAGGVPSGAVAVTGHDGERGGHGGDDD